MTRSEAPNRSIGLPGFGLVLVSAVLILLSLTTLDWYPGSTGPSTVAHIGFADLRELSTRDQLPALSSAYFGWLAWVLLLLVIAVGCAANLPTPAAGTLRLVGALIGLGGSLATYNALDRISRLGGGDYPLHHASVGIWFALLGFVGAGVGATIGPMRARSAAPGV